MENASKALIIVAGMLIGLIIASMFTYELVHLSANAKVYYDQAEITKNGEFNAQFQKFENRKLNAQDVVTIVGLVNEYNKDGFELIKLDVNASSSSHVNKYIKKIGIYALDDVNERDALFLSKSTSDKFTCILQYKDEYGGRVNKVTIKKS